MRLTKLLTIHDVTSSCKNSSHNYTLTSMAAEEMRIFLMRLLLILLRKQDY